MHHADACRCHYNIYVYLRKKPELIGQYPISLRLPSAVGGYKNDGILYSVNQIWELAAKANWRQQKKTNNLFALIS